jgi:hypothetical protein
MMPMRISLEQEYREAGLAFPRTLVETARVTRLRSTSGWAGLATTVSSSSWNATVS